MLSLVEGCDPREHNQTNSIHGGTRLNRFLSRDLLID